MTTFTVAVVSGGLGQPSSTRLLADRLAQATRREAARRGASVETVTVELRSLAHDIADNLLTGFPGPDLRRAIESITAADALIVVTPVFSGSYSGLFKSFFDVIDPKALVGLPVLTAATGGSARHSMVLDYALRPLFSYLKADMVPTAVFAATADFGSDGTGSSLAERVDRAGRELVTAMRSPRLPFDAVDQPQVGSGGSGLAAFGPGEQDDSGAVNRGSAGPGGSGPRARWVREPDPFENLVPFEELLARH